jgi:O-antigen/teichoic acid export membrane protein
MRLVRRNALGLYAVYGAAVISGLVVTPIAISAIGKVEFGVWSYIGGITIFVSLLDLGVGPSIVRFAAEARGRRSDEDTNALASIGLAVYAVIALITIPVGAVIAWFVPALVNTPDDLVWPARICAMLVVISIAARFPLGLFYNLLGGQQRFDIQNLGNFVSTLLYAVLVAALLPHGGGLILLGAITLLTTVVRLGIPLGWLKSELPNLNLSRRYMSRARARNLIGFSFSNFLIAVAQKIVFTTDVVVVGTILGATSATLYSVPAKLFAMAFGIGTAAQSLLFPAFAEAEGAGASDRQRRLLLTGVRVGTAGVALLAMPLIFIPDKIIRAWVGAGYGESTWVLLVLGLVIIVHQPVALFTQYLIARARQRAIAQTLILAVMANVVLSVAMAYTVGLWGVAASTLVTDLAVLIFVIPRLIAPVSDVGTRDLVKAMGRPLLPALLAGAVVLGLLGRLYPGHRLLEFVPLSVLWVVVCGGVLWRYGFNETERHRFAKEIFGRRDDSTTGKEDVEHVALESSSEDVPIELTPGSARGFGELDPP